MNSDRTFQELYDATLAKETILKHQGYKVITIWECEWRRLKEQDQNVQTFLQTWQPCLPLNPCHAFFGGRTNAISLYHKVKEGEEIHYVDVMSLYPWVNATCEYPVGHPTIITNPANQNLADYFGMALVDILPPHHLFHPVLPCREGGKLTFPLCAQCVKDEMQKPMMERTAVCTHTQAERTLRGTWCTPELLKAVEKGYRILRIHEVWHFEKRCTGLFKDYMDQWLKIKQESAGYPAWADTPDKQAQYCTNYEEHQGIALDPDRLLKNPGRKATAKLMLNSFWGKFGENLNKSKVYFITEPAHLYALLYATTANIEHICICTPELLEVVVCEDTENQLDNGKRNIFVAAFTTCHARLKLYQYLDLLQEQLLYFETDSVVYRCKPGQPTVPLGDYLGDMTDELEGGDHIVEFVSGGPKNYGYTTHQGKVCCKVRGFTLNVRGHQQLNYDVMKSNVLQEIQQPLDKRHLTDVHNPHFFTRHPVTKRIRVLPRTKQYALVFDKRVVQPDRFTSLPYGYHPFDTQDELNAELLADL